jgi:DNA helicase HerA-like ATPase
LELLAARHLGHTFEPDRSPFPPPTKSFAAAGDVSLGAVTYGKRALYPFSLKSARLKEHILVAGRSGSGKTNLTFILMRGIMERGIKVLALDWKRGYRDLLSLHPDLRVYTIGRNVAPLRFNPLIPPPGCEPNVWIKLIVDVIASAYFGGEGVISLLVAGIHRLYQDGGVYSRSAKRWPTIADLLEWLRSEKLRGRAAMWQASAERILLAMTYGEFGAVVNTQNNDHVQELLKHNVVLEMDGLSSNSDRTMFSEALTLYLYRYRLAKGPRSRLTNLIVLEEAHNLLLQRGAEARESILETSIRMVRQYGLGYVFVDQSASLLSKVAFANSYATIALSQKLRSDVQAIASAMNLTDEQKQALNTLSIGTAAVRLADEHPEPFLIQVPRCPVNEGSVTDQAVSKRMAAYLTDSTATETSPDHQEAITPIPPADGNKEEEPSHPPSPRDALMKIPDSIQKSESSVLKQEDQPPRQEPEMSREAVRFLADVAARPLSTTVSRYQRLHFSRRKGNAIRQDLHKAGLIEAVAIPTRSGQVVLYQLTDAGRVVCDDNAIDPGPAPRVSLEHRYWASRAARHFEELGYSVTLEYPVSGNGTIDLLAERPGERVAVEVETGKSNIAGNITKLESADFDKIILISTSAAATEACRSSIRSLDEVQSAPVELRSWLDFS